jgi:predicted permease
MLRGLALKRRWGMFVGAILSLGLALGAALVVFSAVDVLLLKPLPFPEQERVIQIRRAQGSEGVGPPVSWPAFDDLRRQQESFEAFAAYSSESVILTGGEFAEQKLGLRASGQLFEVYGLPMAAGRALQASDEAASAPAVVVLSHRYWQEAYQGADVLGRELSIGGEAHQIIGVTSARLSLPENVELVRPLRADEGRGRNYLMLIGRLKAAQNLEQARSEFEALAARLANSHPDEHAGLRFNLPRLKDSLTQRWRDPLAILVAAIVLLLATGSASFANLLLADHAARQREFSTRVAMGGGARNLRRATMIEALTMTSLASVFAIALAQVARAYLPEWLLGDRQLSFWPLPLLLMLGLALLVALMSASVVSRLTWSRANAASLAVSARGASGGRASHRIRHALVVAQIALSLMLLAGAGLMTSSMNRMLSEDLGFELTHLSALRISLPAELLESPPAPEGVYPGAGAAGNLLVELERSLQEQPGIQAAGVVSRAPLIDGNGVNSGFSIEGEAKAPDGSEPLVEFRFATPGYFDALGLRLLAGEMLALRPAASLEQRRVLVNDTFVRKHLSHREAVGAVILTSGLKMPIQGVVQGVRQNGPGEASQPELFANYLDFAADTDAVVVVRSTLPAADILERVRSSVRALSPSIPVYQMQSFADASTSWTQRRTFLLALMQFFSFTALAITLVGLYALFAHAVEQRNLEFGIRQALGATPLDVLSRVLREGAWLTSFGVALGAVLALLMAPLYASQLYGISELDPLVHSAAALLLLGSALLSILPAAWRARAIAPIAALRSS